MTHNNIIHRVFVAGAGQMGQGIAQVIATAGMVVYLYDTSESSLEDAIVRIRWSFEKLNAKGLIHQPIDTLLSRVVQTTQLADAGHVDLVIEAVPEVQEIKQELFQQLGKVISPTALIATNTSSLRISDLAASTDRPDRICGLHFFNPPPLMPLVEVICGEQTSESTRLRLTEFAERIGKQPVQVRSDQAGFIVNRIMVAAMMEAMRILESGQADAADIDKAMRLGCGWKMGPLETADLVGLDVVAHMSDILSQGTDDQVFSPPATLRDHVVRGELGRKTKHGFYRYS